MDQQFSDLILLKLALNQSSALVENYQLTRCEFLDHFLFRMILQHINQSGISLILDSCWIR
jgi:hypothetical protein